MEDHPDIMKKIKSNYSKLSKGHKLIATFILDKYDKAAFMTAAALGEAAEVSESTVVRFAIRIGYEGYKELQEELQEFVKGKLTTVQRLGLTKTGYEDKESLIASIMETDKENIKKVINEIDIDSFNKALELILQGEQIYIIGLRSSSFLAGYLAFYLNFLFENINLINMGPNDIFEQLLKVNSKDIVLVITYPRYSKRIMEILDYSKEKRANIITITDSLASPASQKSDIALIAPSDMLSFVDSLVAPMSLINAIIIALGIEKKKDLREYFGKLEGIWKKYNIYDEIEL
nr:MurR/RpiR family transcriptional regulator [Tissierella sp.]